MGVFITIEGGDGSGKATQATLLETALRDQLKKKVLHIAFPRHGEASSYFADRFLDGAYGGINDIHPDLASLPYAIDRFAAKDEIEKYLKHPNGVVIADRYVGSNLAHNGSKFPHAKERHEYYKRDMHLEYDILGIPKPTMNIVLLVDTSVAQQNIDKKPTRNYTDRKRDIHEADSDHLDRAKHAYQELCVLFPDTFTAINCMEAGKMRSIEDIHQDIVALVLTRLNN